MSHRRVAFQGQPGAYSHLACLAAHPEHEVLPCPTFEDVFGAVLDGTAELGMLPVENSRAGRVSDVHRLLPLHRVHVIGEHYQPVRHQLLVLPGTTWAQLEGARSHPQALAQCRAYLQQRGLVAVASTDTAGAAAEVVALGDRSVGAVASSLAAEIHGLDVLEDDIADAPDNTTRFLVAAREPHIPHGDGPFVTTCLFEVRNIPAALYKALGGFATNGVNLLKLESYQLDGFQWTRFAIDLSGHPDEPSVARAVEELRYFSHELRVLGTYPAHPYRAGADARANQR